MNQRTYYSEEARQQAQRHQIVLAMAVAGISLSLGALGALLFAPTSGENVRREIRDQLAELMDQGRETRDSVAQDVRQNANQFRNHIEDRVEAIRE